MKLVIPVWYGNTIYTDCEFETPSGEVIADTKKLYDENKIFTAMLRFIHGCIISLTDNNGDIITDKGKIKDILRSMPQKTAEHLCIEIMLLYDPADAVEGIYNCPRCGVPKVCEYSGDIDTRDHISDLDIVYYESDINEMDIEYDTPYEIKDKNGNNIHDDAIFTLSFRHITINDCIESYSRYGLNDRVRMQYLMYVKALIKVNGKEVDQKWKSTWGMYIFEKNRNLKDTNKIGIEMNKYGMQTLVEKNCIKCGKEWRTHLNTSNFFASALQSENM